MRKLLNLANKKLTVDPEVGFKNTNLINFKSLNDAAAGLPTQMELY